MNRNPYARLTPLVLVLVILLATACEPPPAPKQPPVAGHVSMTGDSVGLQALLYGSGGTPAEHWDSQAKVNLGWRAIDAQPRVDADVRNPAASPDVLVVEFGHNYWRGMTPAMRNEVMAMVYAPADATCDVLVKPAGGPTLPAARRAVLDDYRALIDDLAARPNTVVVDWAPIVAAHPDYIDSDGIHLATPSTTPAEDLTAAAAGQVNDTDRTAAQAFVGMLTEGVAACG